MVTTSLPPARPPDRRAVPHGWIPKAAKIVLPVVALALAVLVFFWSKVNLEVIRLQISETEVTPEDIDAISMLNARFAGRDERNRQFIVTAETATQSIADDDMIDLRNITANIVLANGARVTIDADAGRLRREDKLLSLSGTVNLNHDRGYALRTTSVDIDLDEKTASGTAPVTGSGPDGEVSADGFRIAEDGNVIELVGRSKLRIDGGNEPVVQ
jgi:lipopolysaccharide export system protein LptC